MAIIFDDITKIGSTGPWYLLRGTMQKDGANGLTRLHNKAVIARGMKDDFVVNASDKPVGSYVITIKLKINGSLDGGSTILSSHTYGEENFSYSNSFIATSDKLYKGITKSIASQTIIDYDSHIQYTDGNPITIKIYKLVDQNGIKTAVKLYYGSDILSSDMSDYYTGQYWPTVLTVTSDSIEDTCYADIIDINVEDNITNLSILSEFDGFGSIYEDGTVFHNQAASISIVSQEDNGIITYTLDGTQPNISSQVYNNNIQVFSSYSELGTQKQGNMALYSQYSAYITSASYTYKLEVPVPYFDWATGIVYKYSPSIDINDPNMIFGGVISNYNLSMYRNGNTLYNSQMSYYGGSYYNIKGGIDYYNPDTVVISNLDTSSGYESASYTASKSSTSSSVFEAPIGEKISDIYGIEIDKVIIYDEYETVGYHSYISNIDIKWRPSYEHMILDNEYIFKIHSPNIIRTGSIVELTAANSGYSLYYSDNGKSTFKPYSGAFSSTSDIYAVSYYKGMKSDISFKDNGKGYYSNNPISLKSGQKDIIYYEKIQRYEPIIPLGYGGEIQPSAMSAVGIILHENHGFASYSSIAGAGSVQYNSVGNNIKMRHGNLYYGAAVSGANASFSVSAVQYSAINNLDQTIVTGGRNNWFGWTNSDVNKPAGGVLTASICFSSFGNNNIKLALKGSNLIYEGAGYTSSYDVSTLLPSGYSNGYHVLNLLVSGGTSVYGINGTVMGSEPVPESTYIINACIEEDQTLRKYFDTVGGSPDIVARGLLGESKINVRFSADSIGVGKYVTEIGGIRHGNAINKVLKQIQITKDFDITENSTEIRCIHNNGNVQDAQIVYHEEEKGITIGNTLGNYCEIAPDNYYVRDGQWEVIIDTSKLTYKVNSNVRGKSYTDNIKNFGIASININGIDGSTYAHVDVKFNSDMTYDISVNGNIDGVWPVNAGGVRTGNILDGEILSLKMRHDGTITYVSYIHRGSEVQVASYSAPAGFKSLKRVSAVIEGANTLESDALIDGGIAYIKRVRIEGSVHKYFIDDNPVISGCLINVDGTAHHIKPIYIDHLTDGIYKIIYDKISNTSSIYSGDKHIDDNSILLGVIRYKDGIDSYCWAANSKSICARESSSGVVSQDEKLIGFGNILSQDDGNIIIDFGHKKDKADYNTETVMPSHSYTGSQYTRKISVHKENAFRININKLNSKATLSLSTVIPVQPQTGGGAGYHD